MRTLRALSEEPSPASLPHAGQRVVPFPPESLRQTKLVVKVLHRKSFFCHKKREVQIPGSHDTISAEFCADVHCR